MTDRHRSAVTGKYVTAEHAEANPDTTVSEARDHQTEPIVRTVGDLTARHIGRRVRWHKCDALIESINTNAFHPGEVMLIWRDMHMPGFPVAPAGGTWLPLDTPCEVLS